MVWLDTTDLDQRQCNEKYSIRPVGDAYRIHRVLGPGQHQLARHTELYRRSKPLGPVFRRIRRHRDERGYCIGNKALLARALSRPD